MILPTYNEREQLTLVLTAIHAAVPSAHILIIDDASPDGTGQIAAHYAAQHTWVRVHHRATKLGLGTAYRAGFAYALAEKYEYVIQLDADGSHQPHELPAMLEAARNGAGLVIGARWIPGGSIQGWPIYRRWVSRTGTRVSRLCLRSKLRDITSGYRVFHSRWLAQLDLDQMASHGYSFQVEVAWTLERFGCPIIEYPIAFVERRSGRSKMSLNIVVEALLRVLRWGVQLRLSPASLPHPAQASASQRKSARCDQAPGTS